MGFGKANLAREHLLLETWKRSKFRHKIAKEKKVMVQPRSREVSWK